MILHMPPQYSARVHALYRECHPTWPDLPVTHFLAYPTLMAVTTDDRLAGYASCSMNVSDAGDLSIFLQDSGVAEWARGHGLARRLLRRRTALGRSVGAKCAVGMTQPDNAAMLNILHTEGFDEIRTIPGAYPDGRDGVLFILNLTEAR